MNDKSNLLVTPRNQGPLSDEQIDQWGSGVTLCDQCSNDQTDVFHFSEGEPRHIDLNELGAHSL